MKLAVALVVALAGSAYADGVRLAIDTPPEAFAPRERAALSRVIYLERCVGGCRVTGGSSNDARTLTSSIPSPGTYTISEFENAEGKRGAVADDEWNQLVQCMKEVYSPFAVEVTDQKPASGSYHLAIIAGNPQEVGLAANVLGVAPLASNCAAFDNVISFSFANTHPQPQIISHMLNVCWTAAQESAHAFGLDHEYAFVDGRSACSDPMTYRADCGGQKFFRNAAAVCGEEEERECRCSAVQNSHRDLLDLFGPGTVLSSKPTVEFNDPAPAADGPLPSTVIAIAGAQRGVSKVELFLNGFPMVTVPGGAFGDNGQSTQAYVLVPPQNLPNSVYDMFVRASDDIGEFTDSETITVTKGGPCTSADACLPEQKCEAGKCFWDPPTLELGETCGFDQECKSLLCHGTTELEICTQTCDVRDVLACPQGLSCTNGVCFPTDGGCCSAAPGQWMPAGMLAFVVSMLGLRRRRTRKPQSRR
jgi:hypothetical protein